MKKFIFISDFDGTVTSIDFYKLILNKYLNTTTKEFFYEWKKSKKIGMEFLKNVFSLINTPEDIVVKDILEIPLDKHVKQFINKIQNSGGDFLFLSAGADFYINKILSHNNITDVKVIANKSFYENNNLHLVEDHQSPYYSEKHGIDKEKFVLEHKKYYEKIFYAGDSEPDLKASLHADLIFAKSDLVSLLKESNYDFIEFNNFKDIENHLQKIGVI